MSLAGILHNRPMIANAAIENQAHELPKVSYSVPTNEDVFKYHSTAKKTMRIAWLVFSLIIFPVGIIRLIGNAINHIATRKGFLPALGYNKDLEDEIRLVQMNERCKRVVIETADNVKLDAVKVMHPKQEKSPADQQKYILFFNGNGGTYESALSSLKQISDEIGVNILCGNYRGVGRSEGFPTSYNDLVMDGEALVKYLLSQGILPQNILIHGWSLGSGVGAHVAALHQEKGKEIHFCSDRSFASMYDEVKDLAKQISQILRKQNRCIPQLFATAITFATPFVLGLTKVLGWNFKSLECYKKINGKKFIIYHRQDQVIPYTASLYKKFKESKMTKKDKQQKLERMALKQQMLAQGKEYKPQKMDKPYLPKNAVRLSDDIEQEAAHVIPLEKTSQYNSYKKAVTHILGLKINQENEALIGR